jgi:hypothetical protein
MYVYNVRMVTYIYIYIYIYIHIDLSEFDSLKNLPSIKVILHEYRRICVWQWKEILDYFVFGCGHIVGWNRTRMVLLESSLQTCMTYIIAECTVNKLLMMDRGNVRNM